MEVLAPRILGSTGAGTAPMINADANRRLHRLVSFIAKPSDNRGKRHGRSGDKILSGVSITKQKCSLSYR